VTNLFPMFMKLAGKQCLVVGAGKVGEPKIGGLIDTGARIHVVALEAARSGHGPTLGRSTWNCVRSQKTTLKTSFLRW
jgi:siroheme synthase (precorrin-2 oxidase/ferrochelatase)